VDSALARLLQRQDRIVTRWQALLYMSDKALRHLVDSGRWPRIQGGLFQACTGQMTPTQRQWAAVLGAGGDRWPGRICLAGLSALGAWGLRGIQSNGIHLLVPHNRQIDPRPGIVAHRSRIPPDLCAGQYLRPPATGPGRSVVDAVQWARSDREAQLIIAASFQQQVVSWGDLERAAAEQRNSRRRVLLLSTAADCADGSHSVAELDLLALCRNHGLPQPTRQVLRRDRDGRVRYVDAFFEKWHVAIEVDGAHHLNVAQMWDDSLKANALELQGYTVLRYPAFAIRRQAPRIAAEIREALIRAGWVPGAG
jgi:very-short-patch-repair endonuclease